MWVKEWRLINLLLSWFWLRFIFWSCGVCLLNNLSGSCFLSMLFDNLRVVREIISSMVGIGFFNLFWLRLRVLRVVFWNSFWGMLLVKVFLERFIFVRFFGNRILMEFEKLLLLRFIIINFEVILNFRVFEKVFLERKRCMRFGSFKIGEMLFLSLFCVNERLIRFSRLLMVCGILFIKLFVGS